jgi:hypothetical protein
VDVDEEVFRRRPAILAIVNRLRAQSLDHEGAVAALGYYTALSHRSREAVLSHFLPAAPPTDVVCASCCGAPAAFGRIEHVGGCRAAAT